MAGTEKHEEKTSSPQPDRKPAFCLYLSGAIPKSIQAVAGLKPALDGLYKEGYDLRVIDIFQDPNPVGDAQVIAVPVLIREYPLPVLPLGSDFSSAESIRRMLRAENPQEKLSE